MAERFPSAEAASTPSAFVTIRNFCCPDTDVTKVYLQSETTLLDSAKDGWFTRFFPASGSDCNCCDRQAVGRHLKITLEQDARTGGHQLKTLSSGHRPGSGHVLVSVLVNNVEVPAEVEPCVLSHGDYVRIYFKRKVGGQKATGPFAFEYSNDEAGITSADELEEVNESLGEEEEEELASHTLLTIPEEMLALILSKVPFNDLMYNVSAVCKHLNDVVQRGVGFTEIRLEQFTDQERPVLERMIHSSPPKSIFIMILVYQRRGIPEDARDGGWGRRSRMRSSPQGEQDVLFSGLRMELIHLLTAQAESVHLDVQHEMLPEGPADELRLKTFLPASCHSRLKYLSLTGNFHVRIDNDCRFMELEELWIGESNHEDLTRYQFSSVYLDRRGPCHFRKLKSLGLVGKSLTCPSAWRRDTVLERLQIDSRSLDTKEFGVFARRLKTLKICWCRRGPLDFSQAFSKLVQLENLAVFFSDVAMTKMVARILRFVPLDIKFLQLKVQKLNMETLRAIFENRTKLEFVCIRFSKLGRDVHGEAVKKAVSSCCSLRGLRIWEHGGTMANDLVEARLTRSEEFWIRKVRAVFGPFDSFLRGHV